MKPFESTRLRESASRFESYKKQRFDAAVAEVANFGARAKPTDDEIRRVAESPRQPNRSRSPAAAARKERLSTELQHERARATVNEAEARGAPGRQVDALATLARERIIGSNDLRDMNYLELAIATARAVCRIRIGSAAGTGFLVGPRVLMTNHHVIHDAGEALQAEAQFDYQENTSGDLLPVQAFRLDPNLFFVSHPTLDFTLVGVAPQSSKGRSIEDYPWVQLIGTLGKAENGDRLNIIQHPLGGLKQIALWNNEIITLPEGKSDFLYYTTDTEPGSSGSPGFNDQWELVTLHHSGVPRMKDGQILKRDGSPWREGVDDPALIHWIANEGARVSAMVAALEAARLDGEQADLRSRILAERPPNPVELVRAGATHSVVQPASQYPLAQTTGRAGTSVSITIPLTISVSLGSLETPAPLSVPNAHPQTAPNSRDHATAGAVGLAEALVIDPDWSTREGYDPEFLGTSIPLPMLSAKMEESTVEVPVEHRLHGDKFVLAYHHYSLAMNKKRRFAWYTAANIDGDHRPSLPKRSGDRWHIDPRIDDPHNPKFQCGEELYATEKTDRGHLTRYLDLAWGDTKREALHAVADTFHFTNCCLQLSLFNQGRDRWQGIEQFLLEQKARKEQRRIVVITGPLFKNNDPFYQNEFMDYAVRIPLRFWKVCAIVRQDKSLSATGFVLDQEDVTSLPGFEEAFDVTAAQVTLQELEERTGLDFGLLTDHDHFAAGGPAGSLEISRPAGGKRRVKPLRSNEDIVV